MPSAITSTHNGPLVWLITGSSSGLGRTLVHEALARGDRVIATARSLHKIKNLASPSCAVLQLDVTDSFTALRRVAAEAVKIWGRIDVLVNNAANVSLAFTEEGGSEAYIQQYQTNVYGVLNVTNAFAPYMRKRRQGTVVIIGSRSGFSTQIPMIGPYASSKAAVHAISETLTVELAPFNVRTLTVIPGGFRTGIDILTPPKSLSKQPDFDTERQRMGNAYRQRAGREPGDPRKAMARLADIVRGEGCAKGRPWPQWLVLGSDAEKDVRARCESILRDLDAWTDVTTSTDLDEREATAPTPAPVAVPAPATRPVPQAGSVSHSFAPSSHRRASILPLKDRGLDSRVPVSVV